MEPFPLLLQPQGFRCFCPKLHPSGLLHPLPLRFSFSSPSGRRRVRSIAVALARQSTPPPPRRDISELKDYDDDVSEADADGTGTRKSKRMFENEAEAKRHHWISRMWAPWEEALSPEAQFAVDALNLDQGDEPIVPMDMMDRLNVNEPIIPDSAESQEQVVDVAEAGVIPHSAWNTPMAFSFIPPKDWPPPGWKVDPHELAFIRGIHSLIDNHVGPIDTSSAVPISEGHRGNFSRWNLFLKQYQEWVTANKADLDRAAEEVGDEYYPGRRRMGKHYIEGMYELPFIYPGQHYIGEVTMVHLYEGAFINFGAVHDGWVPIKRNDWYWLREHIKVGMQVQVEVMAKRDPYRFRFPIQMRFVQPNIDHLIFNRFKHPPIFVRDGEEENMDLITREVGRPFWPRRRPERVEGKEVVPKRNHPFSFKVWQLHIAEQMILDDEEKAAIGMVTPPSELNEVDEAERDYIDADSFWTEEILGGETFDSLVLTQHESELDLDQARKEREAINKAQKEVELKGESFEPPKARRISYMEHLDVMHWQRYLDQHEAFQRDKVNRLEFGMPLEEPGKYADEGLFGENKYNPREKRWRHDYIGDTAKSRDESKRVRGTAVDDEDKVDDDDGDDDVNTNSQGRKTSKRVEATASDNLKPTETFAVGSRQTGEAVTNGEKMVNGTESVRINDINGLFNGLEERPEDDSE